MTLLLEIIGVCVIIFGFVTLGTIVLEKDQRRLWKQAFPDSEPEGVDKKR